MHNFDLTDSLLPGHIWALTREDLTSLHVNNKGTDQPAHLHSLVSTFVIHCRKLSLLHARFQHSSWVSVAEQVC